MNDDEALLTSVGNTSGAASSSGASSNGMGSAAGVMTFKLLGLCLCICMFIFYIYTSGKTTGTH